MNRHIPLDKGLTQQSNHVLKRSSTWKPVQSFVPFSDNGGRKPLVGDGKGLLCTLFPWVGTAALSKKMNEVWWTLENTTNILEAVTTQLKNNPELKAVAPMVTQNRLGLDSLYAEQGGLCAGIGVDHCCTYSPDSTGNWTLIREKVRSLKNFLESQEDQAPQWTFLSWLSSGSWQKIVTRLGVFLLIIVLVLAVFACCVIPLVKHLVHRMIAGLTPTGAYAVIPLSEGGEAPLKGVPHDVPFQSKVNDSDQVISWGVL